MGWPATRKIFRYYFGFAKLLAPKSWIETFGGNLDVLLLRVFTNNVEIGIYDRTMQLLRIPLSLSVTSLTLLPAHPTAENKIHPKS